MSRRSRPRAKARRLTQARMDILWEQAQEEVRRGRPEVARRHMFSARKIAQKTRTKLPRHMRRSLCRVCGTILVPGENCRVRIRHNRSKHVVITCFNCGAMKRYYIQK